MEVNLLDSREVSTFYEKIKPEIVIMAAAKVGGIHTVGCCYTW